MGPTTTQRAPVLSDICIIVPIIPLSIVDFALDLFEQAVKGPASTSAQYLSFLLSILVGYSVSELRTLVDSTNATIVDVSAGLARKRDLFERSGYRRSLRSGDAVSRLFNLQEKDLIVRRRELVSVSCLSDEIVPYEKVNVNFVLLDRCESPSPCELEPTTLCVGCLDGAFEYPGQAQPTSRFPRRYPPGIVLVGRT